MTSPKPDDPEGFFRKYTLALKMWCRRFNTAEIADHLDVHEAIICRWIWHWREISRGGAVSMPLPTLASSHVAAISSRVISWMWASYSRFQTFAQACN